MEGSERREGVREGNEREVRGEEGQQGERGEGRRATGKEEGRRAAREEEEEEDRSDGGGKELLGVDAPFFSLYPEGKVKLRLARSLTVTCDMHSYGRGSCRYLSCQQRVRP